MTSTPSRPSRAGNRSGRPATAAPALVWTALLLVYLLWGSTYLGIRIAVETMPALASAAARFAVAALVLAVVLRIRRGPGALRVDRRQLGSAALVGLLLLAGGNGLVVLAESGPPGVALPSGIAALLVATVPLLVVVLRAVTGDRPRFWTVAGVSVGFVGLVLLVLPSGGADAVPLAGALTVVAGAASWSIGSFLSGRLPMPADPFVATVYEMAAGAVSLGLLSLSRGELRGFHLAEVSGRSWFALGYLMVAGSLVAFTAYVWLLQSAPLSLVSTYAYVNPAVAVALGAVLAAEPITTQVLLGGAVIVVGVALVVTTERPGRPAVTEPQPAPSDTGASLGELAGNVRPVSVGPLTVVVLLGVLAGSATPALAGRFLAPGSRGVRPGLLVPGSRRAQPGLAVAGGVAFGGLAAAHGDDPALPVFLLIAAVGLALSVVDLVCLRLPDPLVGTTAAAGTLGLVAVAATGGELLRLPMAAAGAAVSLIVGLLLALLPGSRLGFGDVKLTAALGLPLGWLGWPALAWGLALPHVLGGVWALALLAAGRVRRDTALPFGPAILAGAWLAALIA